MERNFAVILGVLGKPSDRFMSVGYKTSSPTVFERIQTAARIPLVKGVELIEGAGDDIHPGNKQAVKSALDEAGLELAAVNPNLWGEVQWGRGTVSAPEAAIRRMAVDRIKTAMDLAAELGCGYVGIWPGQDGYDYLLEADYQKMYAWWVEGIQQAADHLPQVRLGLEYKPYEPRAHSFIDSATKALLLLRDIDRPNVGMTFDVGHALYLHENLGEVVALAQREGRLFHVHLNDNYGDWDWDLNFGSAHLYEFIEMLYWIKRTGFSGWYSADLFAYRTDAARSVEESLSWLNAMQDFVDRTSLEQFDRLLEAGDPNEVSRFFRSALFPA
jgi:xylose isomerase